MDYNINFKYKGGDSLSKAAGTRQKAIQASQKAGITGKPDDTNRKIVDLNSKLIYSINKLNQAVLGLTTAMKTHGVGGTPVTSADRGGGMGYGKAIAAGAAGGVLAGAIGWAMQKISQIGTAYIQKVSQQKGTVGIGGFQTGKEGMYLGAELSAMRKEHLMASGLYTGEVNPFAHKVGTIYGLGAEEVGRTSGIMSRYGANYGRTAEYAAGRGVQTDLPKLLSGIAAEMEESVRSGVNASNLSTDIGKEISNLTAHTQTRSVDMALGMVNQFKGIKGSAERGQITGVNELLTWKSGQKRMIEGLNSEGKESLIRKWIEQNYISEKEGENLRSNKNIDLNSLQGFIGPVRMAGLTRDTITGMGTAESARRMIEEYQERYGTGSEAMVSAQRMYQLSGGSMNEKEWNSQWRSTQVFNSNRKEPYYDDHAGWTLEDMYGKTMKSAPLLGVEKQQMEDAMLYKHGGAFAEASIKMEKAFLNMADKVAGPVTGGLNLLSKAVDTAAATFERFNKNSKGTTKQQEELHKKLGEMYENSTGI